MISSTWFGMGPRAVVLAFVLMHIAGCMPARPMNLRDVPAVAETFVVDATGPDSYPSAAAGEANIYSCRYGIALQRAHEFNPPKARMLEALLASEWPDITGRRVVLHRFDVYDNRRLKLLSQAGGIMGGAVGAVVRSSARRAGGKVYHLDRLVVHVDPDPSFVPEDENPVGCNGRGEGEYFASQISAGHSVVVTWVRLEVDGTPFHLRTFYGYQETSPAEVEQAKLEAARLTVKALVGVMKEHLEGGSGPSQEMQ